MNERVIVIGGGLAGLAAAAMLAERGRKVTLLESRPRLGGRASSFTDASTGETIDNCQHVAMGCCTSFLAFCQRVGIADLFERQTRLNFIGPDGRLFRWRSGPWPAPFHLTGAFLGLKYLSLAEKLAIARALRVLARGQDMRPGESFAAWLGRRRQSSRGVELFWEVVLVSALSESMDRIDVRYARKVFVDGFMSNREGWVVIIPRVPLDDVYGGPLTDWLTGRNVDIRLQCGVSTLELEQGRIQAAVLRSGERLEGAEFILAVPQDRVLPLLPEALQRGPYFAQAARFETAPISSVHLWFDRPITELPHAVFVGRVSQWMFRKMSDAKGSHYYQVVVSASREFLQRSTADAIALVRREVESVWPAAAEAKLLHSRVVTEHKAVFSPLPGLEELRPIQQSPIENLQLAGDWTQTGWPATMEGAVRSGDLAALNVLRRFGEKGGVLTADLPASWLFRRLLAPSLEVLRQGRSISDESRAADFDT